MYNAEAEMARAVSKTQKYYQLTMVQLSGTQNNNLVEREYATQDAVSNEIMIIRFQTQERWSTPAPDAQT